MCGEYTENDSHPSLREAGMEDVMFEDSKGERLGSAMKEWQSREEGCSGGTT